MSSPSHLAPTDDSPWEELGVSENASPDELRRAYLQRIKEHPPERDPEQFERIRDAYAVVSDPRKRTAQLLLAADPDAPLASLLGSVPTPRRFVGPKPWLAALKEV